MEGLGAVRVMGGLCVTQDGGNMANATDADWVGPKLTSADFARPAREPPERVPRSQRPGRPRSGV